MTQRIKDIADDNQNELISRLYACDAYLLQMDESTDVSGFNNFACVRQVQV